MKSSSRAAWYRAPPALHNEGLRWGRDDEGLLQHGALKGLQEELGGTVKGLLWGGAVKGLQEEPGSMVKSSSGAA